MFFYKQEYLYIRGILMNKYLTFTISTLFYQVVSWTLYLLLFYGSSYLNVSSSMNSNFDGTSLLIIIPLICTILYHIFITFALKIQENLFRHYLFQAVEGFIFNTLFTWIALYITGNLNNSAPFAGILEIGYGMLNAFFYCFITLVLGFSNIVKQKYSTRDAVLVFIGIIVAFFIYRIVVLCQELVQVKMSFSSS